MGSGVASEGGGSYGMERQPEDPLSGEVVELTGTDQGYYFWKDGR